MAIFLIMIYTMIYFPHLRWCRCSPLTEPHKMIKIWFRDVLIQSHINQLNHGERIYVTYQNDYLPEFSSEPVESRQMHMLTF